MTEASRSLSNWSEMTPDGTQEVAPIFPVIKGMSVNEILTLYRELEDEDHVASKELLYEGRVVERERSAELLEPLRRYTEWVPRYDIERARELYVAFAESADPKNRGWGAIIVHHLPPYDHDLGVHLCRQYLRDPVVEVRDYAYETVLMPLIESRNNPAQADAYVSEFGLTWQDAFNLHMDYREVQYGDVYH